MSKLVEDVTKLVEDVTKLHGNKWIKVDANLLVRIWEETELDSADVSDPIFVFFVST